MEQLKEHGPAGAVFRPFGRPHNQTLIEAIGNPRREAHDARQQAEYAARQRGTDQWSYTTYAPLELRPDDVFSRFHTGRSLFWARTDRGVLSLLPQRNALGYEIGYSGGGPHALAAYLTQVATSDGQHTTAGAQYEDAHPAILAWTQSKAADRGTNELSLSDLQAMMAS
ncbi:hypothetical protein SOM70_37745 [Streptomyces salinarius]|uniref:hypothetical protein n=1 Tax=Streptomyces salinarius TaxID=2762598 RepID=UPI0032DF12F0